MKKTLKRIMSILLMFALLGTIAAYKNPAKAASVGSGVLFDQTGTYTPVASGVYRIVAVGAGANGIGWALSGRNGNFSMHDGACGGAGYVDVYLQAGTAYPIQIVSGQASFGNYITATPGRTVLVNGGNRASDYESISGIATGAGVVNFPSNGRDTKTIQPPYGMWTDKLSQGGGAGNQNSSAGGGGIFGGYGGRGSYNNGWDDYTTPGRGYNGGGDGGGWVDQASGGGGGGGYGGGGGHGQVYSWYTQGDYWYRYGGPGKGGAACVYIDESALVTYQVEHYKQNVENDNFTFAERETMVGIAGSTATPNAKSYTGFSRHEFSPVIINDGAVLKIYYYRSIFNVTYNSNGGSTVAAQTVRYGAAAPTQAPARVGYNFGGWHTNAALTSAYGGAGVVGDMTLYAKWTPRDDTPYHVEHYRQDVNGNGYTLRDTDNLTGTTDTNVTALAKGYPGFHELSTHPGRVPVGSISPDGSLVLQLYYDRDLYSVTFDSQGGSSVEAQEIRYEGTATEPAPPTKQGYDFGGWWAEEGGTAAFNFTVPIVAGVTAYASWTPRNDTPYRVEHYQQDVTGSGYTLQDVDDLTGTTDAEVTAEAKSYPGFHELEAHGDRVATGEVAPDGSLVLRLYYDRELHSVTFDSQGGSSVATQTGIRYEGTATEPAPPTKQGYDFGGWSADEGGTAAFDFTVPIVADVTAYASWTPRNDTPYRVEHYQQDVTGSGYTLQDADDLTGTTDAAVTAEAKSYPGFHELEAHGNRVATGEIAPDGSLVLRLYYDRDLYSVTFDSQGGSSVEAQEIRYEGTATEPAPPMKQGYDFGGWWTDEGGTAAFDFTVPIVAGVTAYASWTPRNNTPYRVEHYQQDVTGSGYTLHDTDDLTGTTDAEVMAEAKSYPGFHELEAHGDRVATGEVAQDGSLVLRLYYDRELHNVIFDSQGGSSVATQTGIRFGGTVTAPEAPVKEGYVFAGWYADAAAYDFVSPVTGDITLTAKWAVSTNVLYGVWHYLQTASGSGYAIKDVDFHADGITGTLKTAVPKNYTGFHENAEHSDRVASGIIAPDGSLVLTLYYDRDAYTVSLFANGGNCEIKALDVIYGMPYGQLPTPTRERFDFIGWYTEESGGKKITETTAVDIPQDHTLYAQWLAEREGVIEGDVVDWEGNPVAGAMITVRAGNTNYKNTMTDAAGHYTITGVKYGPYNLVAEKDGITVTSLLQLSEERYISVLALPEGRTNSIVVVEPGTPEVVVGGVDSLFKAENVYTPEEAAMVASGGKVELKTYVEEKAKESVLNDSKLIRAATHDPVSIYLDIRVTKETTATEGEAPAVIQLRELPELITVYIPLGELANKSGWTVRRVHDGVVENITTTPNLAGEYIERVDNRLLVHTRKFSTYAMTYTQPPAAGPSPSRFVTAYITGYKDGTFRPDGQIARCEAVAILARVSGDYDPGGIYPVNFTDVPANAWYRNYLGFCMAKGYITGYKDGTFKPMSDIDKGEFSAMLARFLGYENKGTANFKDVPANYWAGGFIAQLAAHGIVKGSGQGLYNPDVFITRGEVVTMVNAALGRTADKSTLDKLNSSEPRFSDIKDHHAYYEILEAAYDHKHISSTK